MEIKVSNLNYEFNNKIFKAKELIVTNSETNDNCTYIVSTENFLTELESFMEDPNDDLYDLANYYYDEIWYFASEEEYNLPSFELAELLNNM